MVIDLHGIYHKDVESVLERELLGWDSKNGWEIITGNSQRMRDICVKWLEWHEFGWYVPSTNMGKIVVVD